MRMYVFKSEVNSAMRAFADDSGGSKLPPKFGPWTATGVLADERDPPHGLPRDQIEESVREHGFQLWRMRQKKKQ